MVKRKELTQPEKDARTSFWFIDAEKANTVLAKIHNAKIKINCYLENNIIILNRDFTKKEYEIVFPIVKPDLP